MAMLVGGALAGIAARLEIAERCHAGRRGFQAPGSDGCGHVAERRLQRAGLVLNPRASMGNTFTALHYHFVFSTKNREPWIESAIEERVWSFLGGIARENGMNPIRIGGMPDHVHMAVGMPPTLSVSKALQQIKGGSSKWLKGTFPGMGGFAWQDGYGAFAVSKSNLAAVVRYIVAQREHHATKTFKEEFLALLIRHEIEFKEQYLWD